MSSLQIAIPSLSSYQKRVHHPYAATSVPEITRVRMSLPKNPTSSTKLVQACINGSIQTIVPSQKHVTLFQDSSSCDPNKSKAIIQLYAILKAVADSVEMHKNIVEQRSNYRNSLLLMNSIDTMMISLNNAIHNTALRLKSALLFTAAKGMQITCAMDRVSALEHQMKNKKTNNNGWSPELEKEMREIIEVVKRKAVEDYERLGNLALKINKTLAVLGPLLTGIAALGSALAKHGSSWAGIVAVMARSLADSINALEHGGQVGMMFDIYRNCGGFFKSSLQDRIEATLEEKDCEKRENGELFEMKVAKQLRRSVSQLRQVASKSAAAACDSEGIAVDDEFSLQVMYSLLTY